MESSDPAPPQLHPLVRGFSDAQTYDLGRPRYGVPVVQAIAEVLDLTPGEPILELGAGTGQLSRALLASGLDVTAVEPLEQTRELLAQAIGAEHVLEGVAEEIPLSDGAVCAVLAADAFHWFDEARAMPEIRRVLRAGGGVAILRTVPVLDAPWSEELGVIMNELRPDHPAFSERGAAAALEEDPHFGPVVEQTVTSTQTMDRARIVAYLASMSWVATLPDREQLLSRVEQLLDAHQVSELRHDVLHQIWIARLL